MRILSGQDRMSGIVAMIDAESSQWLPQPSMYLVAIQ